MQPHRRQPTRLSRPWDSLGKNTGVGCHFLLQCMKVKSESEVTQSSPTLRNPMDCNPPGSSIHGIFQARILEWGAIASCPTLCDPKASLSITNSQTLLKCMSIESVVPLNHLILCCILVLPPSIFPSIRVFSNESVLRIRWPKYWSFSFSNSPSN